MPGKYFQILVDTTAVVCRMRISFEGQASQAAPDSKVNCLKVLKKKSLRFLQKAVDKVAVRCRMRASKQQ